MTIPEIPPPFAEQQRSFTEMMINDSVSMLTRVLSAIKKWEKVAWAEFEEWKNEFESKDEELVQRMADYGHEPIADEGITTIYTEYALYGSMAVNIAATVEKQLARVFSGHTILRDGNNQREATKPHFADFMYTLEQVAGCNRQDVKHYGDHMFVRELANRFKHSGGDATQEFVERYGTIAGVERDSEQIPYSKYDWECYIQRAKELLVDVADRVSRSNHSGEDD